MKKKINLLLVSANFMPGSGVGIVEHGIRLYGGIQKYAKDINARPFSLFGDSFFYMINRKTRNLGPSKLKKNHNKIANPDIIHYLSPGAFMSSMLIRPLFNMKAKQIVTIHDLDMINKIPKIGIHNYTNKASSHGSMKTVNSFLNLMEKRGIALSLKKADHLLCVSENTKNDLIRTFGVPSDKISVIYNIVGSNFKKTAGKRDNKKIIIGHLSSYAYNKNAEVLVKAFKNVKSDKFELHLYGAKLPFDISDDKRIKYFGYADDVVKMYNSFDVFVFPSLWEGFGMPIMEAKKCMLPVITYKHGELPDIVKRNTLQFNDVNDLSKILEGRKWSKINLKAAYEDTKKCGEKYIINMTEKLYKKVLED